PPVLDVVHFERVGNAPGSHGTKRASMRVLYGRTPGRLTRPLRVRESQGTALRARAPLLGSTYHRREARAKRNIGSRSGIFRLASPRVEHDSSNWPGVDA